MSDKELIKQEIEKRLSLLWDLIPEGEKVLKDDFTKEDANNLGKYTELESLLKFIDSLPEEPASEDLEEACDNYYDETWDEHGGIAMVVNNCHDIWFPSQATSDFFKAGAEWQKHQMMKDAVEGEVVYSIGTALEKQYKVSSERIKIDGLKFGDKVKLIIVKKEQQ